MGIVINRRQFMKAALAATSGLLLSKTGKIYAQTLVRRRIHCPILMYHYISPLPDDADRYRQDLTVVPELFDAHCRFLAENGYTSISMDLFAQALLFGAELPERPVILTFDDGYVDAFEYAFPILQAYELVGTFFIVTQFMENPRYLTWGQAGLMLEAGMEIENHSVRHQNLSGRDREYLLGEIEGASQAIQQTFLRRPEFFCYPAGRFDETTIDIVRETGHLLAVTTQDGTLHDSSDPYRLGRVRMRGTTTVEELAGLIVRRI